MTTIDELMRKAIADADKLTPFCSGLGAAILRDVKESLASLEAALKPQYDQQALELCETCVWKTAAFTAQTPKEQLVSSVMLDVVPGFDGMGLEVYARSAQEIQDKLSELSSELDDWRHGVLRIPEIVVIDGPPAQTPQEKS